MIRIDEYQLNAGCLQIVSEREPVVAGRFCSDYSFIFFLRCLQFHDPFVEAVKAVSAVSEFQNFAEFPSSPVKGTSIMDSAANVDSDD